MLYYTFDIGAQTGRIQEAVLNLDKQMGYVSRIPDYHLADEEVVFVCDTF